MPVLATFVIGSGKGRGSALDSALGEARGSKKPQPWSIDEARLSQIFMRDEEKQKQQSINSAAIWLEIKRAAAGPTGMNTATG